MGTARTEKLRFRDPVTGEERSPEEVAEAIRQRVASNPAQALSWAVAKGQQAQDLKRESNQLRRKAARARFEFEEFKSCLEELGIEVILEPPITNQRQEAQVDPSSTTPEANAV